MKNVMFAVLTFILPTVVFSQELNDLVNFDSINKDLISNEVIKLIINERNLKKSTPITKDTVPMFAAKFHTMYFEQSGDDSQIHGDDSSVVCDFYGDGDLISVISPSPESRIRMAETAVNKKDIGMFLWVSEINKFYKFKINDELTYKNLIENIFIDFITTKDSVDLILDFSDKNKYLGVSTGIRKVEDDEVIVTSTCVLTYKR